MCVVLFGSNCNRMVSIPLLLINVTCRLALSCYYIFDNIAAMKPKKKTAVNPKKAPTRKAVAHKPLTLTDKTLVTTKEKTHTTIEEHFQMPESRPPLRTPKVMTPRTHYLPSARMRDSDLSPWSNNSALSSPSPKLTKTFSPRAKDQKERKKARSKPQLHEKTERRRECKSGRTRNKKEESHQSEYQNLFMRKMEQRKEPITQLSQQSEPSIRKLGHFQLNFAACKQETTKSEQLEHILDMRAKIRKMYWKDLGYLQLKEKRFCCSIILVQRLWRQRWTKRLIRDFITPRNQVNSARDSTHSKLDLLATQEHTSELIKKYNVLSSSIERPAPMSPKPNRKPQAVDLRDLEAEEPVSPARKERIMKFVESYRQVAFVRPKRESERPKKVNVFGLQSSYSQKCLIQGLYQRVFNDSPRKKNNLDLLTRKGEKNLERSIELINTITPVQDDNIVIAERFETEMQSSGSGQVLVKVQTAQVCIETEPQQPVEEVTSLKSLNMVAEGVIFALLNQFSEQFHAFTGRSVLKKKKRSRLPGLQINTASIRKFLIGMSAYMMDNYQTEVVRRFYLSDPKSYLKLYHEQDEEDSGWEEEEEEEEDDDEINIPVVPGTLFYEYQLKQEAEEFHISEQNQKYSNFLEGLIKIHNLLLANCFSETLEKVRLERAILPWDGRFDLRRNQQQQRGRASLEEEVKGVIDVVCGFAFKRVGQLHTCIEDKEQDERLQRSIREEYQAEGVEWTAHYESLELRIELAKQVEQQLMRELEEELMIFL